MNILRNEKLLIEFLGPEEGQVLNTIDMLGAYDFKIPNRVKKHLLCKYPCMEVYDGLVEYYRNNFRNNDSLDYAINDHSSKLKTWIELIWVGANSTEIVFNLLDKHWNVYKDNRDSIKNKESDSDKDKDKKSGELLEIVNRGLFFDKKTYTKDLCFSTVKHEVGLAQVCETMIFQLRETSGGISTGPTIYESVHPWHMSGSDLVEIHNVVLSNYELLLKGVRL